jgi:hypothetical protein
MGEWFTTSETTVERPEMDTLLAQIEYLSDAACPDKYVSSNRIELEQRATAKLADVAFCTTNYNPYAVLQVDVSTAGNVQPPFTVYWDDGVVQNGARNQFIFQRVIQSSKPQEQVSVVRVAGRNCEAILDPDRSTAVIQYRVNPLIDGLRSDVVACAGTPQTFRAAAGYDPSAELAWAVSSGEILSGQGTPEMTFVQHGPEAARVTLNASYPDRDDCPVVPDSRTTILVRPTAIYEFTITPSTIPPGGTAQIHYKIAEGFEWVSIGVSPTDRRTDFSLRDAECKDQTGRDCTIAYKDTHGAGVVTLTLNVGNVCGTLEKSASLTIQ